MSTSESSPPNRDIGHNFGEIAQLHGYPFQEHFITTVDGYILRLFRISHGLNDTYSPGRPAILLQHGLVDPSEIFIIRGTELSPAFYLANNGYDVWASNSRGSIHSQNHTTLDPDTDPDFWDFTFVDMVNDHQASIEFILNQTGVESLSYFGVSTGVASMLVGLVRQNQWFSDRVNLLISASAVVRLDYVFGYASLFYGSGLLFEVLRRYDINRFSPVNEVLRNATSIA